MEAVLRCLRSGDARWNAATALFAVLVAGIFWAVTLERIRYERTDAAADAVRQNANLVLTLEEQTVQALRGADQALRYLRHAYLEEGRLFSIRKLIEQRSIDDSLFAFIGILNERGDVVLGSREFPPTNLSDRDFFLAHRGRYPGMFIGKPVLGRTSAKWVIPVAHRLDKPDGSFGGAVYAAIDPSYFTTLYQKANLGAEGVVTLVGLDGITRARRVGEESTFGQDMSKSSLFAEQARRPDGNFSSLGRLEGIPRFYSYRTLSAYPLVVAVGTSRAEAMAEFHKRERYHYVEASLASALVVLFAAGLIATRSRQRRAGLALAESEARFKQMAESVHDVSFLIDADSNRMHYVSPAYEEIWGRSCESLYAEPRSWADAIHPDDRAHAFEKFTEGTKTGQFDYEYRIVRPDAAVRWIRVRGFPIRNEAGIVYRTAGVAQDITEQREMQERMSHQAHYDSLTDLPNRVLFFDRLTQAINQAQRKNWIVSLLFIDLDRFKNVNDTLGHAIGDRLLRQVAARILLGVRTEDTSARLGGDEFAVILSDLTRAQDAGTVAQKILRSLEKPFDLDGHEVFVTASIGIANYPSDSEDPESLIKNADAAMFQAKLLGRNTYQFYTAAMNARALETLNLENRLRRAIEREEFLLHFQPKVDLASGAAIGFEALLRWKLPENGLVSPQDFVPLLEDSGLILPVGEWVLNAACAQIRAWQDAGFAPLPVAVNLSAKQFQRQDICATVTQALRRADLDPRLLELEITETAAMQNAEETVAMLRRLKELGVSLAIDDFGTGYSSLSYLKRFPIDLVKIDRSFVTGLPENRDDASIARTVIAMAHGLDMKVIAEGVETEGQRAFLEANGCDQMQGYLVSRPVPAEECTRFLRKFHRDRVPAAAKDRDDALSEAA